jgi:hypothetical protein
LENDRGPTLLPSLLKLRPPYGQHFLRDPTVFRPGKHILYDLRVMAVPKRPDFPEVLKVSNFLGEIVAVYSTILHKSLSAEEIDLRKQIEEARVAADESLNLLFPRHTVELCDAYRNCPEREPAALDREPVGRESDLGAAFDKSEHSRVETRVIGVGEVCYHRIGHSKDRINDFTADIFKHLSQSRLGDYGA